MAEHEKQAVNTAPADVEVGSAEDVEAVMKKYDRESNVRIWTGFPAQLVRYGMALFMLMMIWVSMFSTWEGQRAPLFLPGRCTGVCLHHVPHQEEYEAQAQSYSYLRHCPACGGSWRLFLSDHL